MTYTAVSDFKYGMDRRRPQSSGVPGTLWLLKNAVITRGGDIERTKKFVPLHTLPAGQTHGLSGVRGQLFVFGHTTTPGGMPIGIRYQQLAAPSAPAMARILDAKGYDGKIYSIAEYADGNIYHFFDGARVTDWDALADNASTFDAIALRLANLIDAETEYRAKAFGNQIEITAAVAGTGFTIATDTDDNSSTTNPTAVATEVQANVAEVAEVRASGTVEITAGTADPGVNQITSITVGGTELLAAPVDWIDSHEATANALAVAINDNAFTSGFTASASSETVTIQAEVGTGATPNGDVVDTTVAGDVTVSETNMAGGVTYVAPVAEVQTVEISADDIARTTITITGGTSDPGVNMIDVVTVDGVSLISGTVDWTTSNSGTATALASAINSGTGTHGFTASAASATVTVTTPAGQGMALADFSILVGVEGDVTVGSTRFRNQFAVDRWEITLDGTDFATTGRAAGTGTSAFVNKFRVYSGAGPLIRYSAINDPTDWTDANSASGASFINVSSEIEGADEIVGLARYENFVAIFARDTIAIYSLPADAEQSQIVQTLDNTGTIAPRSVVSYGATDVFYLDETGVRSLRTRDAIQSAYASDVGSAFDPFVQDIIREVGTAVTSRAAAVIEATDGRYMLAIGRYMLILSQFPASKIVAWSYVDFGEEISDIVRVDRKIYVRAGDTIYVYGGIDGTAYPDDDESPVLVETPFISSKDPAGWKHLEGFDMASENVWRVQLLPDPNRPESYGDIGYIEGTTYHLPSVKITGQTSHYALRFTCTNGGYAQLSSTAVHHMKGQKE